MDIFLREKQLKILMKVEKIILQKPRVENFRKLMFREQKKASLQGGGGGAKKVSKREGRVISSKVMVSAGDAAKNSSTCKKKGR